MKFVLTAGQLRVEARADHKLGQRIADVKVNGAARPRTLILRFVLESGYGFGNKRGRMAGGWQFAQRVGPRRFIALAYATQSGLPVAPSLLHAPAYAWWPQQHAVGRDRIKA